MCAFVFPATFNKREIADKQIGRNR